MTSTSSLTLTLEKYKEAYQQLHSDKSVFRGHSLKAYLPEIGALIRDGFLKSVLDYGCGKAELHATHSLAEMWRLDVLDKYDPGVVELCEPPSDTYDLVFCIDVMEHIEPDDVDEVLRHIHSLTKKVAFFSISTRPASKTLPDGTNAHKTVKSEKWWRVRLNEIFQDKLAIAHFTA